MLFRSKQTISKIMDLKSFILFQAQVLCSFKTREIHDLDEEQPHYIVNMDIKKELQKTLESIDDLEDVKDFFQEEIEQFRILMGTIESQSSMDYEASKAFFDQIRTIANNLRPKKPWIS